MRNMSASYKQETNLGGAMQAEFSISSVEKVVSFLQKLFFACNLFTLLYHDLPRNYIFIKQAFYLLGSSIKRYTLSTCNLASLVFPRVREWATPINNLMTVAHLQYMYPLITLSSLNGANKLLFLLLSYRTNHTWPRMEKLVSSGQSRTEGRNIFTSNTINSSKLYHLTCIMKLLMSHSGW